MTQERKKSSASLNTDELDIRPVDTAESVKYDGGIGEESRQILLSEMPLYQLIQEAKARHNK